MSRKIARIATILVCGLTGVAVWMWVLTSILGSDTRVGFWKVLEAIVALSIVGAAATEGTKYILKRIDRVSR